MTENPNAHRLQDLSPDQLQQLLSGQPADVSLDVLLAVEQFVESLGGVEEARAALESLEESLQEIESPSQLTEWDEYDNLGAA